MPNGRGNRHTNNVSNNWDFSLDEFILDVICSVDAVLAESGQSTLIFLGFSQGAAIGLAALSLNEDLNHKISRIIGLAPAMKPKRLDCLNTVVNYAETFYSWVGQRPFLQFASVVQDYCPGHINRKIIHCLISNFLGWKLDKFGPLDRQDHLYRNIFGCTSVKAFIHWLQVITI